MGRQNVDLGPDLCGLSETFSQPFRLSLKDDEDRSGETHNTSLQLSQLGPVFFQSHPFGPYVPSSDV